MTKKTTPKTAARKTQARAKAKPAATSQLDEEELARALDGVFARASRSLSLEDRIGLEYEGRVGGIKAVLDMYAGYAASKSGGLRDIARKLIDDVAAVIDGQGRKQRLRLELMSSLESACWFGRGQSDEAVVDLLMRLVDVELQAMSSDDALMAVAVWRDDRPRPKGLVSKWKFLAGLCERLGLGDVKHDSLERDWRNWSAENLRFRDVEAHGGDMLAAILSKRDPK